MTQHNHSTFVEGCYRCDLSWDEGIAMSDYTPTTKEVRNRYPRSHYKYIGVEFAEFDRWLNARLAEAWDEGCRMGWHQAMSYASDPVCQPDRNPYRKGEDDAGN